LSDLAKYSMTWSVARFLCDSWASCYWLCKKNFIVCNTSCYCSWENRQFGVKLMIFRVQNVPKVRHVKWENKTYYLSMINSLNNKYIKTYCDRI